MAQKRHILTFLIFLVALFPAFSFADNSEESVFDDNYGAGEFLTSGFGFFSDVFVSTFDNSFFGENLSSSNISNNKEKNREGKSISFYINLVKESALSDFLNAYNKSITFLDGVNEKVYSLIANSASMILDLAQKFNDIELAQEEKQKEIGEELKATAVQFEIFNENNLEEDLVEEKGVIVEEDLKDLFWTAISNGGCSSQFKEPGVFEGGTCSELDEIANTNLWDTESCPLAWEWKEVICN